MKMWFAEHRLLHRHFGGGPAIRPVIAGRRFIADMKEGIDENTDFITGLMLGTRNGLVALYHASNEILPTIADGLHGFKQKYTLEDRTNEGWRGTRNAIGKITTQIREKRLFGTLSAVFAEALDGPVDDFAHGVIGTPNTVITPVESLNQKSTHNEVQYDMAA